MITFLLSKLYASVVNRRNDNFDSGNIPLIKIPVPVISIGNISVGGTGKTPFTIYLVNELLNLAYRPAIVGRGYKKKSKGTVIVSDGKEILLDASNAGDEMLMIARELNVPVIAGEKKYLAASEAYKVFKPDIIIVDDAFQHRRLKRDADIVLIDSISLNSKYLLPKGRLREPLSSLERADIIILMNLNESDEEKFSRLGLDNPCIKVKMVNDGFYSAKDNIRTELSGSAAIVSGIANPERFKNSVESTGIEIKKEYKFPDHYKYPDFSIKTILRYCANNKINQIITTSKDYVKLVHYFPLFENKNIDLYTLKIKAECEDKTKLIKNLENLLKLASNLQSD